MNQLKIIVLNTKILLLIFITCTSLAAQDTLTLKSAIDLGLKNNYSIVVSRAVQQISQKQNTLGNAGFLPEFNANYGNTNGIVNTKQISTRGNQEGRGVHTHNTNASALLNWTFFDGFNMFINKARLSELQKLGEYQARLEIENTLSQIITTYYLIVQQQKMVDVIQEAINLSLQRLKLAQSMLSIGMGSEQATIQANVDANTDSTRLVQQLNLLNNTKSDLNLLLAREVSCPFVAANNVSLNLNIKIEELLQKVESQNARVLASRTNKNVSNYTIKSFRTEYLPNVSAFGGYNYNKNTTPIGVTTLNQSSGLTYGLTATINLFNGGLTNTNIQVAKVQSLVSNVQYNDILLQTKNEINKNYNNYLSSIQIINIQNSNVRLARQDVEITVAKFGLGSINAIELRVIQQKLIDAENNLLSAQYAAKQAEIEMQRLSGDLLNIQ